MQLLMTSPKPISTGRSPCLPCSGLRHGSDDGADIQDGNGIRSILRAEYHRSQVMALPNLYSFIDFIILTTDMTFYSL